jgi:hypothetical protein
MRTSLPSELMSIISSEKIEKKSDKPYKEFDDVKRLKSP